MRPTPKKELSPAWPSGFAEMGSCLPRLCRGAVAPWRSSPSVISPGPLYFRQQHLGHYRVSYLESAANSEISATSFSFRDSNVAFLDFHSPQPGTPLSPAAKVAVAVATGLVGTALVVAILILLIKPCPFSPLSTAGNSSSLISTCAHKLAQSRLYIFPSSQRVAYFRTSPCCLWMRESLRLSRPEWHVQDDRMSSAVVPPGNDFSPIKSFLQYLTIQSLWKYVTDTVPQGKRSL